MSFSSDVKEELCRTLPGKKCCQQAQAYGILLYCNTFSAKEIRIVTENDVFASLLPIIFKKAFKVSFDQIPTEDLNRDERKRTFIITDTKKIMTIATIFGTEQNELAHHINFAVLEDQCCRIAFFRGAFLAGGAVTDPQKGYHLELDTTHLRVTREMQVLMRESGFEAKQTTRKANHITYFKRSEYIEDFLTTIGAPVSAMQIMTAKLEKNLRGSVNRRVNCDAANLDKVVEAAQLQIGAIRRLESSGQLVELPEKLQQTAALRLAHPEDTLGQLAEQFVPQISKSALNHRLRKLIELAKSSE